MQDKVCLYSLLDAFEFRKTLATSSSESIIFFGKLKADIFPNLKNLDVVIKLSPSSSEVDNSMAIERFLYMRVKDFLMQETPHLLQGIYSGVCDVECLSDFKKDEIFKKSLYDKWYAMRAHREILSPKELIKIAKESGSDDITEQNKYITKKLQYEDNAIYYLVTPELKGMKLSTFIENLNTKKSNLPKHFDILIGLQVAQALCIFEKHQIRHNDLHLGNIFIEVFTEPRPLDYNVPFVFTLYSRYKITIYDYDHSGIAWNGKRNLFLDSTMCESTGECNEFVPNWDWYTFLVHFIFIYLKKFPNAAKNLTLLNTVLGKNAYEDALKSKIRYDGTSKIEIGNDAEFLRPCECVELDDANKCSKCLPRLQFLSNIKETPKVFFKKYSNLPEFLQTIEYD